MRDFTLEPDEIEPDAPWRSRAPRLVSTGIAPTAEAPKAKRGSEKAPCAQPCESCGVLVLLARAGDGTRVALDVAQHAPRCYTVLWDSGAAEPLCAASRAYAEHRCVARGRV